MEENIEAYRSTHPTYKQFCQSKMFDLYVASFPSITLLFFWNICVKFLHVSNSAVVSSPLSRQSKNFF